MVCPFCDGWLLCVGVGSAWACGGSLLGVWLVGPGKVPAWPREGLAGVVWGDWVAVVLGGAQRGAERFSQVRGYACLLHLGHVWMRCD